MGYWFPAYGHPDGPSDAPWFRVVNGCGYRTKDSPAGASESACFRLINGWAYPTLGLPGEPPTFQVVGSFAYARLGGGPWFRIEERRA
jgi:hypothetical protein